MRKHKVVLFVLFALIQVVAVADTHADWRLAVRRKCRTIFPKYFVYVSTGCFVPWTFPQCVHWKFSCSTVWRFCYQATCPFVGSGEANSYAEAGPSRIFGTGARRGWGWYGPPGAVSSATPLDLTVSQTTFEGNVGFDDLSKSITIDMTAAHISASLDSSYSLLDVRAWAAADSSDTTLTPDKTFWMGTVSIVDGDVTYGGGLAASYWHTDTFNASNLDTVAGNHAMWCGVPSGTPGYATAPGYGNDWDEALVWRYPVDDPSVPTQVRLKFSMNYDTEASYDVVHVEYASGSSYATLQQYDGTNGSGGVFTTPEVFDQTWTVNPGEYTGPAENEVALRIRVTSDGASSDEDGFWDSDGAAQVDLVDVYLDGNLKSSADFEPGGSSGGWHPESAVPSVAGITESADADSAWVDVSAVTMVAPFEGTQAEFDNTIVSVEGDGGLGVKPSKLLDPPEDVPTLGEWGVIVLALLLVGTAAFVIYRRRTDAA